MPEKPPSLSLCMIVKNESATLERCLAFARPHVDELVIVDTGSTDGTRAIAQRFADVFDEIEWPDSFALARNHSFELATGDYILVLDGDEYVPDDASWEQIRGVISQPDLASATLLVRNLIAPGNLMAADRHSQDRIFRNHPDMRYEGRVHNQIEPGLLRHMNATGRKRVHLDAEIIHTGYALSVDRMKQKYEERVRLLLLEYSQPRSDRYKAYFGFQLGVVYFVLQQMENATAIFRELDYGLLSVENRFYTHLLAAQTALKTDRFAESLVHCNEMLTISRTEPIAYYTTGLALLGARQVSDGVLMMLEAYNINVENESRARFSLNSQELLRKLSWTCKQVGLDAPANAFLALAGAEHASSEAIVSVIESLKLGLVEAEMNAAA